MSQKIAIERVDHIGIRVRDLDRALNFYRVLGFDLLRRAKEPLQKPAAMIVI
jgi:catechol 2,3-dioxygenase-like lactoylglutathione lyase family enzyme